MDMTTSVLCGLGSYVWQVCLECSELGGSDYTALPQSGAIQKLHKEDATTQHIQSCIGWPRLRAVWQSTLALTGLDAPARDA